MGITGLTGSLPRKLSVLALALSFSACAAPPSPPPFGPPPAPTACGPLLPLYVLPGAQTASAGKAIYGQGYDRALVFVAGLKIDADGAPNAYHPDGTPGLDDLSSAGGPGNWSGLATDDSGNPYVQSESDPDPGFYVATTSLENPKVRNRADPARYVDSRKVAYLVLPDGRTANKALSGVGAKLGDVAMVMNLRTGKTAAAVWADTGPSGKLGEGSMKLAKELGYDDTSPRTGGTSDPENIFVVFPGSAYGFPQDQAKLKRVAGKLFAQWGGEKRLANCAAALGTPPQTKPAPVPTPAPPRAPAVQ